ncbi:MAG: KH domain-containing protein [Acidimicrobiia bacterium]|nr:KH domain-containing protein [Acidimicrobiia bacterium]
MGAVPGRRLQFCPLAVVSDVHDDDLGADEVDDANRIVGGLSRNVLTYLAKAIVEDPEGVVVEPEERRNAVTLRLHVAPSDMGRVIGRRGRVAQAIRSVVRAAGAKEGVDATVDIVD